MAEWQRNSLADTGAFKALAEQGEAAITTVQGVLQVVQGGAEVAKLFLTGVANPAAKAAELLADAIIASLSNYKESGYFRGRKRIRTIEKSFTCGIMRNDYGLSS